MSARTPNEARVYLRRSTTKQGTGIHSQLEWAIAEARQLRIKLDAEPADLAHMLTHKLTHYKHIYLDDGITGADLDRPGLIALCRDAVHNRCVSHVLVHMPDRLARPDRSPLAMVIEQDLQHAGITIVFSNRVANPRRRGERNIGEDILAMCSYTESGEFLDKLAVRMIQTQANLARKGHWTGGQPPYGFVRVRVMADRTEHEMKPGTSIRQPDSHTEIRAKDKNKIKVWLMALQWAQDKKWGSKRIAAELNSLGIPSPDAGRSRTEQGRKHRVSGKWTPSTVSALLRNRAIIGELRYGVQSEGHHRRLGPDGAPRLLEDADQTDGQPKVIFNPPEHVIHSKLPNFEPLIAQSVFDGAQEVLKERGKHQRGISKIRDGSKYPLSTRVFDLCCGYPMYGRTSGKRLCYACGRYINTDGDQCDHNQVDAEATLKFVLNVLKQKVVASGGRDALRRRLVAIAEASRQRPHDQGENERELLAGRLGDAEADLNLLARNLGRAKDQAVFDAVEAEFKRAKQEVAKLQNELGKLTSAEPTPDAGSDAEVEKALALFSEVEALAGDSDARVALRPVFERLNLMVWLNFGERHKGSRAVRALTGGIITSGDAVLPRRPYGEDGIENDGRSMGGATDGDGPLADDVNVTSFDGVNREEDVSFSKVHRGDKI